MIVSHGSFVGSLLGLVGNVERIGTKVDFSMVGLGWALINGAGRREKIRELLWYDFSLVRFWPLKLCPMKMPSCHSESHTFFFLSF
jgi:hypothetical protein